MLTKIEAYTGSEKAGTREFKGMIQVDWDVLYAEMEEDVKKALVIKAGTVDYQNVIRTSGADAARAYKLGSKIGPTPVNIAAKVAKMSPEVQAALVAQLMSTPGIAELLAAMQSQKDLNA